VSGPLIPFIEAPEIALGFLEYIPILGSYIDSANPPSIKPFGTLVALGVYIGSMVSMHHAKQRKLDTALLSDFIFWIVAWGFVISHMLDAVFYHPDTVARDPLYLLKIWDGLSSYGGLIGGVIGAVAWKFYRKKNVLEFIDVCASAFPLAWVFGRTGCSVVHDHPGRITDAWWAVQYPGTICPEGFPADAVCGRFDLGLTEMVLTIPLAAACLYLWRTKPFRAPGFYIGVGLTCYAPVRFGLDFLRVEHGERVFRGATDLRYLGLTWAQWVCFLALVVGIYFLKRTWNRAYVANGPLAADADAPDDEGGERDGDEEDDPYAAEEDDPPPKKAKKKVAKKKKKKASRKKKTAEDD
jgi:phosphatidylglycerol:prolipoprotein diacylglycerol transferase